MHHRMRWDLSFDMLEDQPGAADGHVNAELLEYLFVFRIIDASDRLWRAELELGHLADNEVVFVISGNRKHEVRTRWPRFGQGRCLAAVALHHDAPEVFGNYFAAFRVLLDDEDFVAFFEQAFRQIE